MKDNRFLTLAFESSCDETAVSVMADGRQVMSNVISSQIDIFRNYGGVVPEIAARHHLENINYVTETALKEAGVGMEDIDLIGVTNGPGLVGALVIGVATAKAAAFAADKPIVGVHHIMGHISAAYVEYPHLEPPFTALIVSGGHTNVAEVSDYDCCKMLGGTRDDAIGEAYDKVARILGLGYPGGPKIDALAGEGDKDAVYFRRIYLEKDSWDFSFSGLKTAVLNHVNNARQRGEEINKADVAAGFQEAAIEVVVEKAARAAKKSGHGKLVAAGGVAANSRLREALSDRCGKEGIELFIPSPALCTDNAAMIGCAAYYKYMKGHRDGFDMDAHADMPL